MAFRFAQRLSQILPNLGTGEVSSLDHYDLEIEDAFTTGGWSAPVRWTPRLAALDYDTPAWVEPNYGNPAHATQPSLRYGIYRTNGIEVAARAFILLGGGGADDTAPVDVGSDGVMYLSLPLPNVDGFPLLDAGDGTVNNTVPGYLEGGLPLFAMSGTAMFGSYSNEMANGGIILPPWSETISGGSFPAGVPGDMPMWVSATTWDASSAKSVWAWGGTGAVTDKSPQSYFDAGWGSGLMISWDVRYFTTPQAA